MDEKDQNSVYFIKTNLPECDTFSKSMLRDDLILNTSNEILKNESLQLPNIMGISPLEEKVKFSLDQSSESSNSKKSEETIPEQVKKDIKPDVDIKIEPPPPEET